MKDEAGRAPPSVPWGLVGPRPPAARGSYRISITRSGRVRAELSIYAGELTGRNIRYVTRLSAVRAELILRRLS